MSFQLIIRDDDVSFFTSPQQLERVYGRLFAADIPVCLAVVPAHNTAARVLYREGAPFDPSIPPGYRGTDHNHPLYENPALCEYLAALAADGKIEICQHGLNHKYMEFDEPDRALAGGKIASGRQMLAQALPDVSITTFIAPYDKLSPTAFAAVMAAGYNLSTRPQSVPAEWLDDPAPMYAHVRHANGKHLFLCDEYLFNHRDDPATIRETALRYLAEKDFLIFANHYWTFFYDWDAPTPLLDAWDAVVDYLLANRDEIAVSTFQDLSKPTL